ISSVASTSARINFSVAASTPLGPKDISVNRNADVSILAGALVITETTPANIAVGPSNGAAAGGSAVTITGTNFRTGAQVYFGGLAATSVRVVDSGTILATAPANAPGSTNVVVVNSDGTWAVAAQAFSYFSEPPIITQVTPSSGPPSSIVTIQGDHFDT